MRECYTQTLACTIICESQEALNVCVSEAIMKDYDINEPSQFYNCDETDVSDHTKWARYRKHILHQKNVCIKFSMSHVLFTYKHFLALSCGVSYADT